MEGKEEHTIFVQQYRNLPQTEMWKTISYQNTYNLNVEEVGNILQGWQSYLNVDGKEENGIFSVPQRNLPQT